MSYLIGMMPVPSLSYVIGMGRSFTVLLNRDDACSFTVLCNKDDACLPYNRHTSMRAKLHLRWKIYLPLGFNFLKAPCTTSISVTDRP